MKNNFKLLVAFVLMMNVHVVRTSSDDEGSLDLGSHSDVDNNTQSSRLSSPSLSIKIKHLCSMRT